MQGYPLDYHYHIREIGFWSRKLCGSIPLNCKINQKELDFNGQQTIYYFEQEVHGIKLKKNIDEALPSSDIKTVLKCIYLLTNSDEYDSTYIAVCKDEKISGILSKANLGKYVIEIDSLDLLKRNGIQFPSNEIIRKELISNLKDYPICGVHGNLKNNIPPMCSRAKANFIADFCIKLVNDEKQYQNFIPDKVNIPTLLMEHKS